MTTLSQSLREIDYGLLVTRAVVTAIAIHTMLWALLDWQLHDLNLAYLPAAERILAGQQLYGGDVTPWTAYRYAPWFAYAMTPLTLLPSQLVGAIWTAIGLACCVIVLWPLRRGRASFVVAVLLGSLLVGITSNGNIQAWLLALVILVPDRWRPLAIGIAASLKATFLPLAIVYLARRQWRAAATSVAVAALLWAPILLFSVDPITFDVGGARVIALDWWPIVGGSAMLLALIVASRWPQHGTLASAVAGLLGSPRLYPYEITLLLVAVGRGGLPRR